MFTNTESLSKTKHNLTFRMGQKLSSKLLFRSSPNTDGLYTFYVSQGSVATQLRCGGMFSNNFTTNFSQNAAVKKFWKSVNIWQRYGKNFVAYFFWGSPCIYRCEDVLSPTVAEIYNSASCKVWKMCSVLVTRSNCQSRLRLKFNCLGLK